ncbi:hypothetical protein HOE04_02565 [archaeon]|jgi:hypothetical protein|nr:hypothetical protein [archaeon]
MDKKMLSLIFGILVLVSLINLSSALIIDSVSMTPDEVAPGDSATIKIEIENNGENDLEDVSVSLDFANVPFAPHNSASDYDIGDLDEDDDDSAIFRVIALTDAESGIYKIPIVINYLEEDVEKVKNSLISITVNSEPVIGVSVEDKLLLKNKENEVLVEVTNKGLSDAKFVEVEIRDSSGFDIFGSKNFYIGDIDSDDFDAVKFKIYFDEDAKEKINLPIRVIYKDGINEVYSEDFNVAVSVYSRDEAIKLGLIEKSRVGFYFGLIVVLVVVYFGYKKFKKRKKLKVEDDDF